MKKIWLSLLFMGLVLGCAQPQSGQMPITEFVEQGLSEDVLLVDVRTPGEFEAGHLEGAVNIDWMAPEFASQWESISKDKPVYVYCKVGGRSAKAAHFLDSLGYQVIDLTGGWDAYEASRKP